MIIFCCSKDSFIQKRIQKGFFLCVARKGNTNILNCWNTEVSIILNPTRYVHVKYNTNICVNRRVFNVIKKICIDNRVLWFTFLMWSLHSRPFGVKNWKNFTKLCTFLSCKVCRVNSFGFLANLQQNKKIKRRQHHFKHALLILSESLVQYFLVLQRIYKLITWPHHWL